MIVIDAVTRLIPGVLGGENSALQESFSEASEREHPHYTRPEEFRGLKVPDVLLSGNHAEIDKWRDQNKK
jgi:tRNA (guanine37-N1)-methyltransferase